MHSMQWDGSESDVDDTWNTKTRYMITWLSAANQMTYAALADAEVELHRQRARAPLPNTAKVIDFRRGRPKPTPPVQGLLR